MCKEKLKTSAYFTLVRPQLEYAAAIWDPYTKTTIIKHLHWRSLQQRRPDIRLVMFYKTLHGIVALDPFPKIYTLGETLPTHAF